MARITLDLTEEHVLLIRNLNFKRLDDNTYGIDTFDMYGGTWKYEEMALILGQGDKALDESLDSIWGPRYEEDVQKHLEELDCFMTENIGNIEEILHQHCDEGISPGTYQCKDNERIWKKIK